MVKLDHTRLQLHDPIWYDVDCHTFEAYNVYGSIVCRQGQNITLKDT